MQSGPPRPASAFRRRRRPLWTLLVALLLLVPGNIVAAAPATIEQHATVSASAQAATFQVTYAPEVPQQARAAFESAVAIWAPLLNSTVPIQVAVTWKPGGECSQSCTLASAAATDMVQGFPNAPRADTRYPIALANSIAERKLNTGADIESDFNSQANWYYGSGTPPSGQTSFVSTAVHELAHGLGFSATLDYANGNGTFDSVPNIFDRFVVNGDNAVLIDTYPNNSAALGQQLTGGNIFFNGPNARAAAGNTNPKLFAPSPWQVGSSISHLDQTTYIGGPNTLMTPSDEGGGTADPGPITLGIFRDLGWPAGSSSSPTLTLTTQGGGQITADANPPTTGSQVTYTYSMGATATLTPQAAAGQTFVGWRVDGFDKGWAVPFALTMNRSHEVVAVFASTKTFPDVGSERADYAAIVALATRTTIRGYANGNYGPDEGVQRAQMAALIARATSAGPGTPTNGTLMPPACLAAGTWDCEDWGNNFSDRNGLNGDLWRNVGALQHYQVAFGYDGAACAAKGVASPCYAPTASVSYVETVVFITRAMVAKGYWVMQPNAAQPYAGVPAVFGPTVATYQFYTSAAGGVPGAPNNWNDGATRGWFARALWVALNSYWSSTGTLPDGRPAGGQVS